MSGLRGNLFTVPPLGVSIGVSSIAEIQLDCGLYQKLNITEQVPGAPLSPLLQIDGDSTDDVDDIHIGAKVQAPVARPRAGRRWQLVFHAPAEREQRIGPRQGRPGFLRRR